MTLREIKVNAQVLQRAATHESMRIKYVTINRMFGSILSFRYPSQDLKGVYEGEFITSYQNALHLTRVHCATFYQSALRHEQHEDVIPSFCVDSSEKFCSDLPVKRCEGDRD